MEAQNRNTLFMSSVLTMLTSQLVVKAAGLLYRLVITNIDGFGDAGNGFYTAGFQLYTLLLAVSSVGIPNAISKLVSAEAAIGHHAEADHIFRLALRLFFLIGLFCSGALFFGADFIAVHVIKMDGVQYTLQALAPSVTFVCVSSVIRGYFLGLGRVEATSRSQMLEQICKSVLTVVFVLALSASSAEIMSAGANFATTVATSISVWYLTRFYCRHKPAQVSSRGRRSRRSALSLCRTILAVSIPISLGSIIIAIGRVIDTATITRGLSDAFAGGIPGQPGLPTAAALNDEAVRLAGMLSKSDSLINLPLALNIAFATVLVPTISSALASGRRQEAEEKVAFSLLISVLLIFPCSAGLIVLARPIYQMIYPHAPLGWQLLQISAVGLIFMALNQTVNGSLQGLGKVTVPAKALLCGVAVKVALNNLLIRIPCVNIYGATIGSVVCHAVAFAICFHHLQRALPLQLPAGRYFWKPLFCTGLMAAAARGCYAAAVSVFRSNSAAVLLAVFAAVIGYLALVFATHILTPKDILQLPLRKSLRMKMLRM